MIFLIFGSPLAHLEPKLELFEVWDDGDDDLSHHYLPVSSLGLFSHCLNTEPECLDPSIDFMHDYTLFIIDMHQRPF